MNRLPNAEAIHPWLLVLLGGAVAHSAFALLPLSHTLSLCYYKSNLKLIVDRPTDQTSTMFLRNIKLQSESLTLDLESEWSQRRDQLFPNDTSFRKVPLVPAISKHQVTTAGESSSASSSSSTSSSSSPSPSSPSSPPPSSHPRSEQPHRELGTLSLLASKLRYQPTADRDTDPYYYHQNQNQNHHQNHHKLATTTRAAAANVAGSYPHARPVHAQHQHPPPPPPFVPIAPPSLLLSLPPKPIARMQQHQQQQQRQQQHSSQSYRPPSYMERYAAPCRATTAATTTAATTTNVHLSQSYHAPPTIPMPTPPRRYAAPCTTATTTNTNTGYLSQTYHAPSTIPMPLPKTYAAATPTYNGRYSQSYDDRHSSSSSSSSTASLSTRSPSISMSIPIPIPKSEPLESRYGSRRSYRHPSFAAMEASSREWDDDDDDGGRSRGGGNDDDDDDLDDYDDVPSLEDMYSRSLPPPLPWRRRNASVASHQTAASMCRSSILPPNIIKRFKKANTGANANATMAPTTMAHTTMAPTPFCVPRLSIRSSSLTNFVRSSPAPPSLASTTVHAFHAVASMDMDQDDDYNNVKPRVRPPSSHRRRRFAIW